MKTVIYMRGNPDLARVAVIAGCGKQEMYTLDAEVMLAVANT